MITAMFPKAMMPMNTMGNKFVITFVTTFL